MSDYRNWRLDAGRTNWSRGESPSLPFSLVWKAKNSGDSSLQPPIKIGKKLLFVDIILDESHGSLYCFDSESGKEEWRFQNPAVGGLCLAGGSDETAVIYQAVGEGIFGINSSDGTVAWHLDYLGSMARDGGVVDGDELILPVKDQAGSTCVCKIDTKTGHIVAQFKVPFDWLDDIAVGASIIVGVVIPDGDEDYAHDVIALSRTSGEILWTADVLKLHEAAYGPPSPSGRHDPFGTLVANNQVFIAQLSGNLWCLDENTGACRWSHPSHSGHVYVPAYADRKLYFRERELFICLDAETGEKRYAVTHSGIPSSFGQAAGTVAGEYFFFSDGSALIALDRKDGRECWRRDYGKKKVIVWGPCLVSDGRLYVAGGDNYIYCFGPK